MPHPDAGSDLGAAEIGADLVKCIHPGDDRAPAQIIERCPARVVVAGGKKQDDSETSYRRARGAIAGGAAGLVYGRNIYEANDPAAELECYREIVHGR